MRLGNSLGNNKGKKYLRKDEIDIVFATKADHFNKWFGKNYSSLVSFIQSKGFYDEDVFSETYINVYNNILFKNLQTIDYQSYMMRAYYTNYIQNSIQIDLRKKRYPELSPNIDKEEVDSDNLELEEKQKRLESDIMDYIYSNYNVRDFELFKMYISLKPAVNYATLAQMTNLKVHCIQRIISKLKKDIVSKRYNLENNIPMYNVNPIKKLSLCYVFHSDYELLWELRQNNDYTIICTVTYKGVKSLAELTPNGEIFNSSICFSDFEHCSKDEFIKQCSDLHVGFIKPVEIAAKIKIDTSE